MEAVLLQVFLVKLRSPVTLLLIKSLKPHFLVRLLKQIQEESGRVRAKVHRYLVTKNYLHPHKMLVIKAQGQFSLVVVPIQQRQEVVCSVKNQQDYKQRKKRKLAVYLELIRTRQAQVKMIHNWEVLCHLELPRNLSLRKKITKNHKVYSVILVNRTNLNLVHKMHRSLLELLLLASNLDLARKKSRNKSKLRKMERLLLRPCHLAIRQQRKLQKLKQIRNSLKISMSST